MSGSTMSYMMWVHSPAPASLPYRPPPTAAPPVVPPANYAGNTLTPPTWFSTMVSTWCFRKLVTDSAGGWIVEI